jgi:plasmid segregation protein ParM
MSVAAVFGFDDGYGDLKLFNGVEEVLIPSIYAPYIPFDSEFQVNLGPYDHIKTVYEGKEYLVGEGVNKQNIHVNWVGSDNKHADEGFPILLQTALAIMAKNIKEDVIVVDPLMMGLPIDAEKDVKRHRQIRNLVLKTHKVDVTLADGTKIKKEIKVKSVIARKQAFGSVCDLLLNNSGEVVDTALLEQFIVVSDIGAKTHNILTIEDMKPQVNYSKQSDSGVFALYKEVNSLIERATGKKISEGLLPSIVRKGKVGRRVDLREQLPKLKAALANTVATELATHVDHVKFQVERVIFTGGGSEVLREYLDPRVTAEFGFAPEFLDRFATARGLRKYGVMDAKKRGLTVLDKGSLVAAAAAAK